MGILADLRRRCDAAYAEATEKCNRYADTEASHVRGTASVGDSEWAWFEAVMAHSRYMNADRVLNLAAGIVGRMVDRVRGFGE